MSKERDSESLTLSIVQMAARRSTFMEFYVANGGVGVKRTPPENFRASLENGFRACKLVMNRKSSSLAEVKGYSRKRGFY